MQTISSFYTLAKEFLKFLDENEISNNSLMYLITTLMKLYIAGTNLPNIEPDDIECHYTNKKPLIRIHKDIQTYYFEFFNPFIDEEPVCSDLNDDIMCIYDDLQCGIEEYESGKIGNAVCEWRVGLQNHWGQHAVDAIRALHTLYNY